MRHDELEMIAVGCRAELRSMGVELRVSQNFEEIRGEFAQLDKDLGPAGDPASLLLTRANSFWIFATKDGLPILGFAVRMDDLVDEDAQAFLIRSLHVIFGVHVTRTAFSIFAGRHWGKAAYFGDLKANIRNGLATDGGKIIRLAFAYAHYRAFTDFGSDIHYCFLRAKDRAKGASYGFLEGEPFDWETDRSIYQDGNPEWIMQTRRERLPSLLADAAKLLPQWEGFAVDKKQRLGVVDNSARRSK
ncbi:hypothetical protein [uncultured Tateyamaria sp.]|uniref:hypothetical protein n=1 Tax=uncultured Tateyamaria sp. TaxID=455651 RepID=UPI002614E21C|nr:hypothetical protein [uncultured Tateyamaria sp.]